MLTFSVPNTTSENNFMMKLYPGIDVRLSCVSSGVPQPHISWFRDGFILMNGDDNVSIVAGGNISELTVTDIEGQQGGEYNCNGTNEAGTSSLIFTVECKLQLE